MTEEQKLYIEKNLGKKYNKEIAKDLGISKWRISMFLNKKGPYEKHTEKIFKVELSNSEMTWLI